MKYSGTKVQSSDDGRNLNFLYKSVVTKERKQACYDKIQFYLAPLFAIIFLQIFQQIFKVISVDIQDHGFNWWNQVLKLLSYSKLYRDDPFKL